MAMVSEVDTAMTAAIQADDVTALHAVLDLRPEVNQILSNISIQGANGQSAGVRPLQLACIKSAWGCALELIRRGADGIGCTDADGVAPLFLTFVNGGAEGWMAASAILNAEADRTGIPEPNNGHAAKYRAAQQASRRLVVGETAELSVAAALWTRVSVKGLSLLSVFFTKLHDVGPHTPGLVDVVKILRLAARCGMPLPAIADIEAHKQFAWFVTGLLESPGAPGPLVVLTRLGLTGAWPLDSVYSASSASVWHIAANSGSPTVVAAVATGGRDGINCEDHEAHCPLELACYGNGGDEGTAAAMVEAGANPDRPCTLNKIHPLELALIHRNWFDFARAALNAGACIEADVVRTLIGRQNFQALDIVIASKGHVRQPDGVVEQWTLDTVAAKWAVGLALLLLNGSNPNATDDETGRTLLHSAALHGSTECCRVLVAVGASLTRVAPTRLSTPTLGTPLLFAINASEWDTAALLSTCPAANAALNDGLAALEFVPPSRRSIWHSALANLPAERPLLTRAHLEEIVAGARALPSTHTPQRSAREEARTLLEAHASLPTPHQQRPQPESVRSGAARPAIASPQPRPTTAEAVPAVSRHARAGADGLIEPAQNSDHPVYAVASHSRRRTTSSVPRVLPQLPRSKSTARHAPRRASAPLPNPRASRCNYPSSSGHGTCMSRVIDGPGQHCDRHTCTSAGCTSGKPSKNELCARCGTNAALAAADADSERDATCVICMEHPKTALLQHGGDGHLCCCMSCAKLLTARGDPCPLCRKPIDAVIQVYS